MLKKGKMNIGTAALLVFPWHLLGTFRKPIPKREKTFALNFALWLTGKDTLQVDISYAR